MREADNRTTAPVLGLNEGLPQLIHPSIVLTNPDDSLRNEDRG